MSVVLFVLLLAGLAGIILGTAAWLLGWPTWFQDMAREEERERKRRAIERDE